MRTNKPSKLDKKHPAAARDTMDDIKDLSGDPRPVQNEIKYSNANRDRALGENDRTGRHFDGDIAPDEGSAASKEHEAD
jgi:hypothetical protein